MLNVEWILDTSVSVNPPHFTNKNIAFQRAYYISEII